MSSSYDLDRRDFVKIVLTFLVSIMGLILGLPVIGYLISPATKAQNNEAWIPVGPLQNYPLRVPTLFSFTQTTKNGWEKTVSSYGAYILRLREDEVKVYSNMCTHLSCRVTWHEAVQEFICPCHGGHFELDGSVCAGPAPTPLTQFQTKTEEGNLFIHFMEGGHV